MKIELTAIIDYAIPEGAEDSKPRQLLSLAESVITRAFREGAFTTLHAASVRSVQHDSRILEGATTQDKLTEALDRLRDILKGDDGQAYKEARKFLERIAKPSVRYQTMSELIEEIKPPEQVMRSWLQGRGVFISQKDDPRVAALSHMPSFKDKERINEMRDVYRFAVANGKRWPADLPPDYSPPKEMTDTILRQLYTAGFNDGIASRVVDPNPPPHKADAPG